MLMEERRPSAGEEMVKWLKPGGCVLVLVLTALALLVLFSAGRNPIPGYTPPHDSDYYALHPEELKTELETHVFPQLSGVSGCEISDGRLVVTLTGEDYAVARSALLHYYDKTLFEFVVPTSGG